MNQGQNAYRWFSSLLLHRDFIQLGSNLLLFLALGVHLERRYGTRRIAILCMIAGVGGNFFSAAFEVSSQTASHTFVMPHSLPSLAQLSCGLFKAVCYPCVIYNAVQSLQTSRKL